MDGMSKEQAAKIGADAAQQRKTLQRDVLSRFMDPAQMAAFEKSYEESLWRKTAKDRAETLSKELTREEADILREYLTETDIKADELSKRYGLNPSTYEYRIMRLALKAVYQKLDKVLPIF